MANTARCLACFTELRGGTKYCPVCGSAEVTKPKDSYHLVPGILLHERYLIGLALGAGGFSIVYKAWDTNLQRIVAVKEFFPSGTVNRVPGKKELLLPAGDRKAVYYAELDRFMQEAKAMVRFKTNTSIVHVLDYFEENDAAYIVMEFLEGIDLKDYLKNRGGPLTWEEASHIIFPIMGAIKDIHEAGMLHRDIAPDNIRITADNKVKLMDFGAVRLSEKDTYVSPNPIIKNGYTPVEQYTESAAGEVLHTKQGPYTDVYALGATLYEMLIGIRPEESKDREQALNETNRDIIARPSELGIALPEHVERSVMLALAVDKNLRFKSIDQMEQALKGNRAVLYPEQAAKRRRNRILLTTAAAVAMVFFTAFAGVRYIKNYLVPVDLNDFIKHETKISVLLPIADDADAAWTQLSIDSLQTGFAKFIEEQYKFKTAINLEFKLTPTSEYEEALPTEAPAIFAAQDYSSQTIEQAAKLDWVYERVAADSFLLNDRRKADFSSGVFAPISFDIPVIYYNDKLLKANGTTVPTESSAPADLPEAVQGTIAVSPDCLAMLSECYGAALSETEKSIALLDPLLSANKTFADFKAGEAVGYIGRFTELPKVRGAMRGYWAIGNIPVAQQTAIYGTAFCVNKKLSEANDQTDYYAAMLFLSYLYHPDAQRILFVQNVLPGIPVNPNALELYKQYRRGPAAALLEGAPGNLTFLGENNRVSLAAEKKLAEFMASGAYTQEAALDSVK
jgi:serine/threonine protein kinase